MLKEEIQKEVAKAQNEITATLQRLHEATGLTPRSVSFDAMDVRTSEDYGVRSRILIAAVSIEAST